jgi:hypothetical protein
MGHSIRKYLTLGVATITASAIAFTPSIEPASPSRPAPAQIMHMASPAITLTAGVQPLAAASVTDILTLIAQHYVIPPSAGQPFPTPQFLPAVTPTSVGSSIISVYNAVEPWVRYGFDLAAYAVGWVPYVGWLAPQITIFYNFGERIARSITYNIAYWLDGNISFGQGLANVGVDTVNAFIQLGIDQWNFWLWPLPPLPPIFPGTAVAETAELTATAAVTENALSDAPKLKKKDGEAVDEATEAGQEPAVLAVKKPKEPKEPKEPKVTTSSSVDVSGQREVRGAPTEKKATDPSDASVGNKKADNSDKKADNNGDTGKKDKKDEKE